MEKNFSAHSLAYNPALDGLRGVAVFLVFLTHLDITFSGGRFGVDLFFVLSGYLISEVLINSQGSKNFLWVFYFKRFLRLFPALAALCVVVAVICGVSGGNGNIYKDVLSSILYTQSWTSGLKDGFSLYLGHTWSLSVEEQFYLLWPFIWIFAARFGKVGAFLISLLVLVLAMAYAIYMSKLSLGFDRIYFAADTRFQAILIGAVGSLACKVPMIHRVLYRSIASISIFPMVAMGWIFSTSDWSVLNSFMVSIFTLMLILRLTMKSDTLDSKVLSLSPLVGLGKISYGFYLWHAPILVLLQNFFGLSYWYVAVLGLSATLIVSFASYVFVEQPALRLRAVVTPEKQFKFGLFVVPTSVLLMSVGIVYFQLSDIKSYIFGTKLEVTAYGPKIYQMGDKGLLQPDGSLVMWMTLNSRPDMRSSSTISGVKSVTMSGKDMITIVVPQTVLETPGKHTIQVFTSDNKVELPVMEFEIVAASTNMDADI